MKKYLIVFFLLSSVLFSFGQTTAKTKPDSLNNILINELKNRELETYKKLVETAEKTNGDLRETNHWFIGLTITFIVLVLGSQIFYNVQLNNRKLEAIREGFAKELEEYKSKVSTEVEAKVSEVGKEVDSKGKEHREELDKRINLMSKVQEGELKLLEKDTERGVKSIEAKLDKLDAEVWLLKGVESNALTGYVNSALKQAELNNDLNQVLEDITMVLKNIEEVSEYNAGEIEKLITLIEEKYKARYFTKLERLKEVFNETGIYSLERTSSPFQGSGLAGGLYPFLRGYKKTIKRPSKRKGPDNQEG